MDKFTIESLPKCSVASELSDINRMAIGCTKYAQYVTRENG